MKTEAVHVRDIRPGDAIVHGGEVRTVSVNNIKRCPLMGVSIFGDSYHLGHRPVTRVVLERALPNTKN